MLISLSALQSPPASADAGWITAGGSAHLIEGKAGTVSMQSEIIKIHVSKHMIKADCSFTFVNTGPACTVRMGFPDQVSMPMHDPRKHIRGSFLSFSAFADGKKLKSEIIEDNDIKNGFGVWHASSVTFGENESKVVRHIYTVRPGIVPVSDESNTCAKSVYYILKTAASWGKPVKQGDIYVTFDRLAIPGALKIDLDKELDPDEWNRHSPQNIVWMGNIKPNLEGRTVHFAFANLVPTADDNILLLYDRMNAIQALGYSGISMGTQVLFENLPSRLRRKITKPNSSPSESNNH